MYSARSLRLLGTAMALLGIIGCVLMVTTETFSPKHSDGNIVFPISLVAGIVMLIQNRPRKP